MELKDKKLFLLDMDGTIYLDDNLFEGVEEFLAEIKNRGGRYIFMTNNSSKSVSAYVEKLNKLGIAADADDFMTSIDATIEFLKDKYGEAAFEKLIYVMGTQSFIQQMKDNGFNITVDESPDVDVILCGFDRELTYKKLEDICIMLLDKNRNIDYFATNPDWVCPTDFGSVPDCGSMCQMLEIATGRKPYFIGKPQPDMARLSIQKTGFKPEETLVIGDRLYTDIACGVNAGVDTCFVLSGEGTLDDLKKYDVKPTYILENINELLRRI
ncbi:MAG: HAD-IIA family hydrolase [Firmicutes bacterium]|nr:HAD-IIA family hydrolase [Bacillota bacterium]